MKTANTTESIILGIDVGTQALKVLVLTQELSLLGKAAVALEIRYPKPGWAEQDPADWERALRPAVKTALEQTGTRPRQIVAVGITGQLDGCLAVAADGSPLTPCAIWIDRRAGIYLSEEMKLLLRRDCGINPDPSHFAAKARWLLDHGLSASNSVRFHQPVSYLVSRLTAHHLLDHSLASTTMLYSLKSRGYEPKLLEAFGLGEEQLPRVADADSLAGFVSPEGSALSGIPEGVPVAVGTGDDFASPLGGGISKPGTVACVIGTAEVVGALSPDLRIDPEGMVETHPFPGGLYFVENPGWLAGGAVAWFQRVFGLEDVELLNRLAAEVPPGSLDLQFLPALNGAMSPEWIPEARGCFYGITPAHTTGCFARALLEGCAYGMIDVTDRLMELGVAVEEILLMGGGSASQLWSRIRASVSNRPVYRVRMVDTAPLGAAMLAAVAAGIQPDLDRCTGLIRDWLGPIGTEPGESEAYRRGHREYRRLFESLRPMYRRDHEDGRT